MLSYPIPEAEELLSSKLSTAQQSLSNCEEDLDFLREQVTVRVTITTPHTRSYDIRHCVQPQRAVLLTLLTDDGSRHSACLQLGYLTEAQRGEGCWNQQLGKFYIQVSPVGAENVKIDMHD